MDQRDDEITEARAVIAELLAEFEKVNTLCCYASEEDTDAKPQALLMIGGIARAAIAKHKEP